MAALTAIGVTPTVITHVEVKTVAEWTPIAEAHALKPILCKNLFLKGKKGELVLLFALAATQTDLKLVCKAVGAASGTLRMAPEDVLNQALGVVQGSVTPLALVNDEAKAVTVVLDTAVTALAGDKLIAVHPCRNDKTVMLTVPQLQQFFAHLNITCKTCDFSAVEHVDPAPKAAAPKADAPKTAAPPKPSADVAGETKLGIDVKKAENFPDWYSQVITKSDMIEYYDVSGCYILRPWAFEIWEHIKAFFDGKIKEDGVENCYFPMFVSKAALEREKDHVEGFAPEVAWVTKAGSDDLPEPVAIRPTSETVMYPIFAKWIRSHRDLPLRLNQWCNVVRWEFSNPTPFIRTREFLWQEGHTAFVTKAEADTEVRFILDLYRQVYEDLLAIPVEPGIKTEKEKFAGGHYTTTVETFIPSVGRGCQGATSHCLGQNFGKMFNIEIEDPAKDDGSKLIPWQNSWGLTTRTIGVMVMVHGDDKGLVLPPRVASVQVVIVPVGITAKTTAEDRANLMTVAKDVETQLKRGGVRVKLDSRDNYTPGWKFNHWELKGVPMRIEIGPKDIAEKKLATCRRLDSEKGTVPLGGPTMVAAVKEMLETIQSTMFAKAKELRASKQRTVLQWADFVPTLNDKCLVMAPWCESRACEDAVKKDSAEESKALMAAAREDARAPSMGAKSLCMPFNQMPLTNETCICKGCTNKATKWVLWGRSY